MLVCTRRLPHTLLQFPLRYFIRPSQLANALPGTFCCDTTAIISPAPSLLPVSQEARSQHETKALIEEELRDVTYQVDFTAKGGILHADPKMVQAVNNKLRATFKALISGGSSSVTKPRFPGRRFTREARSYEPLVHLLNKIVDTTNRCIPQSQQSQLRGLRFLPFAGEIKEAYGSHRGLKPDGVGVVDRPQTKQKKSEKSVEEPIPKLSWGDIEVFIESKSSVKDMIRQSGFNYTTMEAYVFVFHHAGLSSSRPLNITTAKGFNNLVKHIVGILSIGDEAAYGLDTTRVDNFFRINNRYYEVIRILYMRGSFRGRSTTVYHLQASNGIPESNLISRTLTLANGTTRLPDKFIYKLAYPVKGRSHEGPLFSQFTGQFGIADVIGYHECGTEDPHGSTSRLLNGAKLWKIFESRAHPSTRNESEEPGPEERGLQCIALTGKGEALIDLNNPEGGIPSPAELLESVLHAIIGHYILFDKGILHRDVSTGNILRCSKPIMRPALDKFDCTRNVNHCRGFLIDGDQAAKWREVTSSLIISGTVPFMSWRILRSFREQRPAIQTALDDLESFLWVLIWCIVHLSKDIEGAMAANEGIEDMLIAWSGNSLEKFSITEFNWDDAVFGDLVKNWSFILRNASKFNKKITDEMSGMRLGTQEWDDTCNELEMYCKSIYEKVLQSGFKNLEGVRVYSVWHDVVAANKRSRFGSIRRQ